MDHEIPLPVDDQPFWFRSGNPLANYQSQPDLPSAADVVVIGAGLTGASTAYHLAADAAAHRLRVVILDAGDPAGEASGRNGGNFELIPENSVGAYEGLAKERFDFLSRTYRSLPREVLQAESERQASLVLGIALRNREILKSIILTEGIKCDFSPRGWLHLACNEAEERGICEEVILAARHGQRVEIWPRSKIRSEFGFDSEYLGRFVPGDGTYHPFKYVCGLFQVALRAGVQLYTRTRVLNINSRNSRNHEIATSRGTIRARNVVVATNAFTSQVFPELAAIRAHQSQIMVTEDVADRARGRVVTCNHGPTFFNQPRTSVHRGRAALLLGGGADRPMKNPASRRRSLRIHNELLAIRDRFFPELHGRHPSTEWIGPMGFTPDQLPAIGFLRPGIIVAAGFNGYGGSYTTAAGYAAAEMALTGRTPEWVPGDVFSPRRLLSAEPLFMTDRQSLLRIAQALCGQLRVVDKQIAEAHALGDLPLSPRTNGKPERKLPRSRTNKTVPAEALRRLPGFRMLSPGELATLARAMTIMHAAPDTQICQEGKHGETCYVILEGGVAVTTLVSGEARQLALLGPGSFVGEVSVIDGGPRSATCTVVQASVLGVLSREAVHRMLKSAVGLKLLALLNEGIVAALRNADLQLLRATEARI
jgi:glycine/D-amino acid oxidase-like deaminating enzyme